jgi:coproporphyrinogen III oxidase-like Fe-S oxidoreductase
LNEYVMVSLRRAEGISVEYVRQTWGAEAAETIVETAQNMLRSGWLQSHSDEAGEWLAVPAERFLVSDAVISTFFEV